MVTSDAKEEVTVREKEASSVETSKSTQEDIEEKKEIYDIAEYLRDSKHKVKKYPNGITVGLRFNQIAGSRSMHADIVYVLDWRTAAFPRNPLSMKSVVLELLDRSTAEIMIDFDLKHRMELLQRKTARGKVSLPVIRQNRTDKKSFLHETRTVYVVTQETAPSIDFSWLTDPGRIVSADTFLLARKSDIRSAVPEIEKRINSEKWDTLQAGIELSWAGILMGIFAAISIGTAFYVELTQRASSFIPFISAICGLVASICIIAASRKRISDFNELMADERERIQRVGDDYRIQKTKESDAYILSQLRTMRFIISPLMARVVGCLDVGDFEGASEAADRVLDELVRLSPYQDIETKNDPGLDKFLELFYKLDPAIDKPALSMVYVALTDSSSDMVESGRIIDHVAILLENLYRCGIISPASKIEMDQILNSRGLKEAKGSLDKELEKAEKHEEREVKESETESGGDELANVESHVVKMMKEDVKETRRTEIDIDEDEHVDGFGVTSVTTESVDEDESSSPEESTGYAIDDIASEVVERAKGGAKMREEKD